MTLTVILAMLIATGIVWGREVKHGSMLQMDGTTWEVWKVVPGIRTFWITGFLSGVSVVFGNYLDCGARDSSRLTEKTIEQIEQYMENKPLFMSESEEALRLVPAEHRESLERSWRVFLGLTLLSHERRVEKENWENASKRLRPMARVGPLKDGMDKFYQDHRNQQIALVDALYVANMEIKGSRPELIDAQVRYLRMQPTSIISLEDIDWTKGKAAQEEALRAGWFADPIKENPTKEEDYSLTRFFRYGGYK